MIIKCGDRVLSIFDAPVEDAAFEYFYEPFFSDEFINDLDEFVLATKRAYA